ncbi:acyltransferase family protein [Amnibacterium kyonggiense]
MEEQFYLLWPLAVLLAAAVAVRRRIGVRRAVLVPFLVVAAASFTVGAALTASGSPAAYFVTPTRMWELAAGGLLAVLLADRQPPATIAAPLQVVGIALIATAAIGFTARTPMPGTAALLPVAGAVAVIAGGEVRGLRRIWALPPVRAVGAISYSLYLWHWPVIVFTRVLLERPLDVPTGGAVVVLSLLLATGSYLLVEGPLRRIPIRRAGRVVVVGVAASLLVAGGCALPILRSAAADADELGARAAVLQRQGPAIGWPQLTPVRTGRGPGRSTSSSRTRAPSRTTWRSAAAPSTRCPPPPRSASPATPAAGRRSRWSAIRTSVSGRRPSPASAGSGTGAS